MSADRPRRAPPRLAGPLEEYRRLDNWHGPLEALWHWMVILAVAWMSIMAWRTLPAWGAALVYVAAVMLIGGRQRGLSGLLHQASHHAFMADRRANAAVAALLGGWPVLQSFSGYVASHVRQHHGRFGADDDPDYAFFREAGLYDPGRTVLTFRRYLLRIVSPLTTLRYVVFLLRHRIWTPSDDRRENALRLSLYVLVTAGFAWAGALDLLLLYWIAPLVTAQAWIGALSELYEHYPLMERRPVEPWRMSHNRDFGPLWRFLLGEHRGEGYHLVHHLYPSAPYWSLHRMHRELCADSGYAALPFARTPRQALQTIEAELAPIRP
jgi:fatty acid desaturase